MIKNLDENSRGFVDFKRLCTFLCLLATPVPNELDITQYTEVLRACAPQGYIDEEFFIEAPAFFEYSESSAHSEASKNQYKNILISLDSVIFDRVSHIKALLFQIHKETVEDGLVIL